MQREEENGKQNPTALQIAVLTEGQRKSESATDRGTNHALSSSTHFILILPHSFPLHRLHSIFTGKITASFDLHSFAPPGGETKTLHLCSNLGKSEWKFSEVIHHGCEGFSSFSSRSLALRQSHIHHTKLESSGLSPNSVVEFTGAASPGHSDSEKENSRE